jgi:DNA-binding transcriptional ArsR family regulator
VEKAAISVFLTPLDALLASRAAIGTLRVLARTGTQMPASAIAAAAGLSRVSVYSVLNRSAALGLVHVAGSGQSRLFAIDSAHALSAPVQALFVAEARAAARLLDPIESWAAGASPLPTAIWLHGGGRRQARPAAVVNVALVGPDEAVHEQAGELRRRIEERLGEGDPGTGADMTRRTARDAARGAGATARIPIVSIVSMTGGEAAAQKRNNSRLWRELVRDAVPVIGRHPDELLVETTG